MLFVYALAVWCLLVFAAIANGAFRESVLRPRLGERPAGLISTIILSAIVALAALALVLIAGDHATSQWLAVGIMWTLLTIAFEFGFGHYVQGDSWGTLFAAYDVTRGSPWPLVPLTELAAPTLLGGLLG